MRATRLRALLSPTLPLRTNRCMCPTPPLIYRQWRLMPSSTLSKLATPSSQESISTGNLYRADRPGSSGGPTCRATAAWSDDIRTVYVDCTKGKSAADK